MARFKPYDYKQRTLQPISLEEQIVPGTLEYAIHEVVERKLDLSIFDRKYRNDETGRLAIDPKILLKIVLFAYSRGLVGSRRIEQACHDNIIFMALACNTTPDHSTIAHFVSSMEDEILPLFQEVLLVCFETGLLGGSFFAIDGCKIPSNASKKWSGTFVELKKRLEHIQEKLVFLIKEHIEADKKGKNSPLKRNDATKKFRERQIERLERESARIKKFLKAQKPKIGKQGTEIKSNVIDNESAKMSTSHGTIQGYNAQAVVDDKNQVIVAASAVGEGTDTSNAAFMLPIMKKNLGTLGYSDLKGVKLAGDSGYFSVENLKACDGLGLDAFIPDNNFRQRDERLNGQKMHQPKGHGKFPLGAFTYDQKKNVYKCPAGHELTSRAKQTIINGRKCQMFVGKKDVCGSCALNKECLSKRGERRVLTIPVPGQKETLTDAMKKKIDSPEGKKEYGKRLAIVEPVFANITEQKRLKRFTLRGKIKATVQWNLWCMTHNIEKIINHGKVN